MTNSRYELISGIDFNNLILVANFRKYIESITNDTILKKVYKNSEDCHNFIINYIPIDNNTPSYKVDDISFLSNGEKIIGYLIGRIKKDKEETSFKLIIQEYEYSIPEGYDLDCLKNEYLYRRVNSNIKGSETHEESYQK